MGAIVRFRTKKNAESVITASGGNVFADLGLPDAEELDLKAVLARKLGYMIRWT